MPNLVDSVGLPVGDSFARAQAIQLHFVKLMHGIVSLAEAVMGAASSLVSTPVALECPGIATAQAFLYPSGARRAGLISFRRTCSQRHRRPWLSCFVQCGSTCLPLDASRMPGKERRWC